MKAFGGRGMWLETRFFGCWPRVDLERGRPDEVEGMGWSTGEGGRLKEAVTGESVVETLEGVEAMVIVDGVTWEESKSAREGEAESSRNV